MDKVCALFYRDNNSKYANSILNFWMIYKIDIGHYLPLFLTLRCLNEPDFYHSYKYYINNDELCLFSSCQEKLFKEKAIFLLRGVRETRVPWGGIIDINLRSDPSLPTERSGNLHHYILALLLYLGMSIIYTYPLIFNLQSSFYGFPGDPYGGIWGLWWTKYAIFDAHISPLYSPIVGSPFGTYSMKPSFVLVLFTLPITLLLGEVASYNLIILFSFVMAGSGAYFLIHLLTKNKYASFTGGCIFTFAPYHFAHAIHHFSLTQMQWFPFCLAFLVKLRMERSYKNALLFTFFLILQMFSDPYYALFAVIMIIVFIALETYSNHKNILDYKTIKLGLLISLITIIIATLTYIFLMKPAASHPGAISPRDLSELVVYSARPWDFFMPMIYNPLFGNYTFDFVMTHLHGSNPVEQTIYLGYIPLLLALFAIYCKRTGRIAPDRTGQESFAIFFSLVLIVVSLLFMLPAYIQVGDHRIPFSLSYLLYKVTSIFRVMVRFDLLIMLAIAILAGIGLKYLTKSKVAILIILALIMLEYTPVPVADPLKLAEATRPGQNFPFSEESYRGDTTVFQIPEIYYWLAEQDNITIMAEYPMAEAPSENESIFNRYLFYQRIHKKALINGVSPESKALNRLVSSLNDSALNILSELGARHVLVHDPLKVQNPRLKAIRHGENITLYEISGDSTGEALPPVYSFMEGWYYPETWNGTSTRWMSGDAGLFVFSEENCTADLSLRAASFLMPRTLIVSAGDHVLLEKEIPSDFVSVDCPIGLKKGFNVIRLYVPEGCASPRDFPQLRNSDMRCLSLAVQNITIVKGPAGPKSYQALAPASLKTQSI